MRLGFGFGLDVNRKILSAIIPCKDKAVQWWNTITNGIAIDKIGSSGSEVNRPEVGGWYFDGDGTRYVNLNQTINLGTEHTIEFETTLNNLSEAIFGTSVGTGGLIATIAGTGIRYRASTNTANSIDISCPLDGERHVIKIVRESGFVSLFVDGAQIEPSESELGNGDLNIGSLFAFNSGSLIHTGNCSYIKLTDSTGEVTKFSFESGNQDTRVLSTNPDVYGTIQNATGSDRVQTTALESDMDTNGVVVSDGASYWYDAAKTQLVPSGKRSMVRNGKATSFYDASGELATASFVGELKANVESNSGSFTANGTDNYLDTGIVPNQDTVMKLWGRFESYIANTGHGVIGNGERYYVLTSSSPTNTWQLGWGSAYNNSVSADTEAHKIEVSTGDLFIDGATVATSSDAISAITGTIHLCAVEINGIVGAFANFTIYKAEIIHNGEIHIWDFNPNDDEAVVYTIDGVVQTPPTIQGTVASGQWGTTGYKRQLTTKKSVTDADALTTVQMYNHDDPDNIYALVVPDDDFLNQDNPRFTKTDSGEIVEQVLYEEELVDPCLTEVETYMGF